MNHIRTWIQVIWTALTNGYVFGYLKGTLYRGKWKKLCVPGLNCYSCPGAVGSCPIGALQSVLGKHNRSISWYMIGFFLLVGSIFGRFVCGFLCPFGLIQEGLHKVPILKRFKRKNLPGHRWLKYLKYGILIVFVILLPLYAVDQFGGGAPAFCKWLCPSGTLMGGWIQSIRQPQLRRVLGGLFAWKSIVLIGLLLLSMFVYRPFCKYLCPLGAVYSVFNPIAFYHMELQREACISCGKCTRSCPMGIAVMEHPNDPECIRCGKCIGSCPEQCLKIHFGLHKNKGPERENLGGADGDGRTGCL